MIECIKGGEKMTFEKVYKIFSNIPTIRCQRIDLRRINTSDTQDVYEYASDPDVSEYLLWKPHKSIEYTKDYLNWIKNEYRIGKFYDWGIAVSQGIYKNKMIGTCGFTSFDLYNNSAEVGYVLNKRFWGQQIADEALSAVIKFGFEELMLHRIEAKYIIGNDNSRRVMEKCGMTFEGIRRSGMIVKGEYRDIGVCSVISDEYFDRKTNFEDLSEKEYEEIK